MSLFKITRTQDAIELVWPEGRDRRRPWIIVSDARVERQLRETIRVNGFPVWRYVKDREDIDIYAWANRCITGEWHIDPRIKLPTS